MWRLRTHRCLHVTLDAHSFGSLHSDPNYKQLGPIIQQFPSSLTQYPIISKQLYTLSNNLQATLTHTKISKHLWLILPRSPSISDTFSSNLQATQTHPRTISKPLWLILQHFPSNSDSLSKNFQATLTHRTISKQLGPILQQSPSKLHLQAYRRTCRCNINVWLTDD